MSIKNLRIKGVLEGTKITTDYFSFDLPVTKGVLEECGLLNKKGVLIHIKPLKPKEAKKNE